MNNSRYTLVFFRLIQYQDILHLKNNELGFRQVRDDFCVQYFWWYEIHYLILSNLIKFYSKSIHTVYIIHDLIKHITIHLSIYAQRERINRPWSRSRNFFQIVSKYWPIQKITHSSQVAKAAGGPRAHSPDLVSIIRVLFAKHWLHSLPGPFAWTSGSSRGKTDPLRFQTANSTVWHKRTCLGQSRLVCNVVFCAKYNLKINTSSGFL